MNDFQTLYIKPKNWLRELMQKLFLKILLKIFPKKFLFYKNKIRNIMNIKINGLFFLLRVSLLRFQYPLYFNLPSQHLYSIHITIKLIKILRKQKIDVFLIAGSLLGAVRQESFAGRPQDIDLGVKEDQLPQLMDAIPLLIKEGARSIRRRFNNKYVRLQILFPHTIVDIAVFRKENEIWIGEPEKHHEQKFEGTTFPTEDLEHLIFIKAYGKQFPAPVNPEIYLEKKYGKNWRIPDKKQFFWNKNKLI